MGLLRTRLSAVTVPLMKSTGVSRLIVVREHVGELKKLFVTHSDYINDIPYIVNNLIPLEIENDARLNVFIGNCSGDIIKM